MADIFFSYSSVDRERVRPVHDALVAQGFDVFWDQEVPAGADWDTWIRQNLANAKCAIVFWSATSVASKNVRHEATVADEIGKLIPVLLEPLKAGQFPMGLYTTQAVNLADWNGEFEHEGWRQLDREVKDKLMPAWVQQQIGELRAELVAERARRKAIEHRDKALQSQIEKEVQTQQELKRERDDTAEKAAALRTKVEELRRTQAENEARASHLSRRLSEAEARPKAATNIGARGKTLSAGGRAMQFACVLAALATASFWAYQLIRNDNPAQMRTQLDNDLQQAKAGLKEANAKINDLTRAKADSDAQVADLTRRLSQVQAASAGANTKVSGSGPTNPAPQQAYNRPILFSIKPNMKATGTMLGNIVYDASQSDCADSCAASPLCRAYSYNKKYGVCYRFSNARLEENTDYDSGTR